MTDNAMQSLVETKLTKSEAIDLLVEELRTDLEAGLKQNELDLKDARRQFRTHDIKAEVTSSVFELEHSYDGKLTLQLRLTADQLTESGKAKLARIRSLEAMRDSMQKQSYAIDDRRGKAKNAILKTMLEGTEEGQRFLELLGNLKLKVQPKLLAGRSE